MTIDLVPLKQFSARIEAGWSMVPGYPLNPGDYAVTMQSPGHAAAARSNKVLACASRNETRGRPSKYPQPKSQKRA